MRVVLIVAGAITAVLLCTAGAAAIADARTSSVATAAQGPHPAADHVASRGEPDPEPALVEVAHDVLERHTDVPAPVRQTPPTTIGAGLAFRVATVGCIPDRTGHVSSTPSDEDFAVFRSGDASAPAIKLFRTASGAYDLPLAAGRYDVCTGGYSVTPRCGDPGEEYSSSCPPGDKKCKCTPPDASRAAWHSFCQTIEVGKGVVEVDVGRGLGVSYSCTPESACVR